MSSQENKFWQPKGYEGCLEKMRNGLGLHMLLEEYARERAKLSERYATDLKNLLEKSFKKMISYKEEGTAKEGWMSFFDEADQTAKTQREMSTAINNQLNEEFRKWLRTNVKEKNQYKVIKTNFSESEKQWMRLLADSDLKRKKYASAANNLKSIENNSKLKPQNDGTPQDAKKVVKYKLAVEEEKVTEKAYNDSLATLRDVEGNYKKDMEANYESFQKLEESRMKFIQYSFKSLLEVFEKYLVTEASSIYTRASEELEKINISKDIEALFNRFGPAGDFPVYEYQNCENQQNCENRQNQDEEKGDNSNSELSD